MEVILNDESSHTFIHNDPNPGNVLVHNNDDIFFIDWHEARYELLFLDIT
ncbi:phosphotransferase [Lysinibacillus sp. NPDC048646]